MGIAGVLQEKQAFAIHQIGGNYTGKKTDKGVNYPAASQG
jgi:hypothetical protein